MRSIVCCKARIGSERFLAWCRLFPDGMGIEEIRLTGLDGTTPVPDWDPAGLVLEEFLFDAVGEDSPVLAQRVADEIADSSLQL